jgi:hypothetical protein
MDVMDGVSTASSAAGSEQRAVSRDPPQSIGASTSAHRHGLMGSSASSARMDGMCGTRACPCQAPPRPHCCIGRWAESRDSPSGRCFSTRRVPRMPTWTIDSRRTRLSASPTSAWLLLAAACSPLRSTRRLGSLDPRPLRQGTRIAPQAGR